MDTRPLPSSFILVFLAVTMVIAIASGCTIGHLAQQNVFIANGLCAGTTAALAIALPNAFRKAINKRHLSRSPIVPWCLSRPA